MRLSMHFMFFPSFSIAYVMSVVEREISKSTYEEKKTVTKPCETFDAASPRASRRSVRMNALLLNLFFSLMQLSRNRYTSIRLVQQIKYIEIKSAFFAINSTNTEIHKSRIESVCRVYAVSGEYETMKINSEYVNSFLLASDSGM